MKKLLVFLLILLLAATLLFGCGREPATPETEYFCRVMCLKEAGLVVWVEGFDNIYVKNASLDPEIQALDTVVMVFSQDDLIPTSEPFVDYFGDEDIYSYTLESPKSIRYTTPEEPTFG